jgi:hypothetical protein
MNSALFHRSSAVLCSPTAKEITGMKRRRVFLGTLKASQRGQQAMGGKKILYVATKIIPTASITNRSVFLNMLFSSVSSLKRSGNCFLKKTA